MDPCGHDTTAPRAEKSHRAFAGGRHVEPRCRARARRQPAHSGLVAPEVRSGRVSCARQRQTRARAQARKCEATFGLSKTWLSQFSRFETDICFEDVAVGLQRCGRAVQAYRSRLSWERKEC